MGGNTRQRASSCARGVARLRGAAGVVAYGTSAVGAVRDDADGRTNDDGNYRPDDANSGAHSVFGDAGDADGRTRSFSDADDGQRDGRSSFPCDSHARDRWVRNASVVVNHVMMRSRGTFATRSAVGVSGTRVVFSDGLNACGQSSPASFQARGQNLLHGPYAGKVSQRGVAKK